VQERDWFGAPNQEDARTWLQRCEAMLEDFEQTVFELHSDDKKADTSGDEGRLRALPDVPQAG
jgi:hypothetical protein